MPKKRAKKTVEVSKKLQLCYNNQALLLFN